ncbi:MAG: hypothetical protein LBN01_00580 [Endomicrobium sp.]|nr:hypothetical protein [Endomicrobium sp.]
MTIRLVWIGQYYDCRKEVEKLRDEIRTTKMVAYAASAVTGVVSCGL